MKARAWSSVLGGGLWLALAACSATKGGTGVDGSGSAGRGSGSGGTQPVLGGLAGTSTGPKLDDPLGSAGVGAGPGDGCQTGGAEFIPKVPSVLLLVDRSGTMFKDAGGNPWATLRDGVLEVVESMSRDVRFGLVAVTGEQGGMCPLLDEVAPADDNYAALAAKYMSLTAPAKGESPGMRGVARAAELLSADTSPGDKYVLFVTDGEQDYCDDGNFACPTDSMVYHLQDLAARGFKTFVFGLPMQSTDAQQQARYPQVLQAFADAGAGLGVAPVLPPGGGSPLDIFYNCDVVPAWKDEATQLQRPALQTLGTYAAAAGGAKVFAPDPNDKDALKKALSEVLSGVKSCTFDIGGEIKVLQNLLHLAHVYVQDQEVQLDPNGVNGWYMPTPTQIELVGEACSEWRMPQNTKIAWDFPCRILVPK